MDKFISIKENNRNNTMKVKEILRGQQRNSIGYNKQLNPYDSNDIARTLMDLDNQGYPVDKAIKKFQSLKKQDYPFW